MSRTRERILAQALALFNAEGEPHVTTNQIADELDMSPGNLHYHFRRKTDLVTALFEAFDTEITELLGTAEGTRRDLESFWFYLHLLFESIGRFRFLFRDINHLLDNHQNLKRPFNRILAALHADALGVCEDLAEQSVLVADALEQQALADQIVLTILYWLPFSEVAHSEDAGTDNELARAAYQVFALVWPFLREPERSQSRALALGYLA